MRAIISACLLATVAWTFGGAVSSAQAQQYEERVLQNFERDAGGWTGGEVTPRHATVGENAYRVVIRGADQGFTWNGQADFSGWDKIKFDTYNEGEPISVSAIFQDADGKSYRSWYQLVTRGRGYLEYNLRGLTSTVPELDGSVVSLDLSRIRSIRVVADTFPGQTPVSIDNVRLSRGPEPRVPLELFRPETEAAPVEEVPGNVIRNGNFELSMAHWNSWGSWDGGDYRFGTVTGEAAHTGSTAATIIAHRVGRGGIFQTFTTPAAGRYNLRFAYRGEGGANRMRALIGPDHIFDQTLDVTDQWQVFEREVQLPAGDLHIYLYHISGGTLVLDTISLAPANGPAAGAAANAGQAQAQGNGNRVEVRGNQVFVNGEAFFPLGFWTVRDPAHIQDVGTNLNFWMDLDHAAEAGVMGAVDFTQIMRGHRPDLVVEAARQHAGHPALFAWYLCDEPDHSRWNVPPHMVRAAHQTLKEWDDSLATTAIIMSWHRSMAYQYADTADILITLIYTPDNTERVIRAARWVADRKPEPSPAWIGLQSGWEAGHPVPTLENARVQAYAAIANGVTGIFWFELDWPMRNRQDELRQQVFPLVRELRSIHDVLASADSPQQPTTDNPNVHLRMKDGPEGPVVIAVNVTREDAGQVRINLPQGVRAERATVEFEDRQVQVQDGVIVDNFGAQQRHVYRLGH